MPAPGNVRDYIIGFFTGHNHFSIPADPSDDLRADYGYGEMELVNLIAQIGAHYGLNLGIAEMRACNTVGDVIDLISRKLGG